MEITLRHCNCLKTATLQVRDLLEAEGFVVRLRPTLRPGVLQLSVGEKVVWSWALWRRQVPSRAILVALVSKA